MNMHKSSRRMYEREERHDPEPAEIAHEHREEGQEKRYKEFEKEKAEHHEEQRKYERKHHRSRKTEKRQNKRHKAIGFKGLESKVEREARRKHPTWSSERIKKYAAGAASNVAREIAAKHGRR